MVKDFFVIFNCFISLCLCFILSVTYIVSLHVWKSPFNRDHPSTIKKRFISVFFMTLISPGFVYLGINNKILERVNFYELLGLKTQGLCQAFIMPLFLTMILFLGPTAMKVNTGLLKLYTEPRYWLRSFNDLVWLRNHLIAPFSEEFTYRCCMLPLLLQHFSPLTSIIICPLFFGISHFHHMHDRIKGGLDFKSALYVACFQSAYTTIFGMYSAYILLRTGHFASSFIVHAFCNHMGFPNFNEISSFKGNQKFVITSLFIIGFVAFCCLLKPLTEPSWYNNNNTEWII